MSNHWNNHTEIKAWLPAFRAGALRSPSCRSKKLECSGTLPFCSLAFILPCSSPLLIPMFASPESQCFFSPQMLEDVKKGCWEHKLLLFRNWTSHWHPVIRINSLQCSTLFKSYIKAFSKIVHLMWTYKVPWCLFAHQWDHGVSRFSFYDLGGFIYVPYCQIHTDVWTTFAHAY